MEDTQRLDRWLWFARFFKSRSLASRLCASGRLRLNGRTVAKAHHPVRIGDVLTFAQGPHIRVVRVTELGMRRGPALEARTLYEDLTTASLPEAFSAALAPGVRERGAGRPTKAERRATDRLHGRG